MAERLSGGRWAALDVRWRHITRRPAEKWGTHDQSASKSMRLSAPRALLVIASAADYLRKAEALAVLLIPAPASDK